MQERIVGIMGAMEEEISSISELMQEVKKVNLGRRTYYTGKINGTKTILVFSRWGKVAAATSVSTLILKFGITELIFTGVAGAIHPELNIGDIVIGKRFYQHDMDARPIMKQFEIPLLDVCFFESGATEVVKAAMIIKDLLRASQLKSVIETSDLHTFHIHQPECYIGDIASGDKFFSAADDKHLLMERLHSVLCVEMEGAAVAQVCYEYQIPFTIIRTISDAADEKAELDFPLFIKSVSSKYSRKIIEGYFFKE